MSVIVAQGVSKRFVLRHNAGSLKTQVLDTVRGRRPRVEEFWALRDVSFRIDGGESLGLVGRNGSGKSTLLKLIAGIHRPSAGHLLVARTARIGSMIELGVGFHPELSGAENVYMNAAIHGFSRDEIDALYPAVVEYSELGHFMDVPLKSYSSGMHMRLGFAIAAQMDPDVLLLDEIFAVGDEEFQRKCLRTLASLKERGRTIVFVSHSADAVRAMCRRVCVLDAGRLVFDGDADRGLDRYRRVLATHQRAADGAAPSEGEEIEIEWHRCAAGPRWEERGVWQLELLRRWGLTPEHVLFDMACGDFSGAVHLLPFMRAGHYWGYERQRQLFDAATVELTRAGVDPARGHFIYNDTFDFSAVPHKFDIVIAASLFVRLPLNQVARAVAAGLQILKPEGTFLATWYDVDPADAFADVSRCDGYVTHGDREPYHYSFPMVAKICEAIGCRAERVDDRNPAGETLMVIRRR
jgi:ABC-type polysaccharide/polyol phosphate transport system ATPase subunit